jgi:hypothetical protein
MVATLDSHPIYFVRNHHFQCKQTLEAFFMHVFVLLTTRYYLLMALLVLHVLLEHFIRNTIDYACFRFAYFGGIYAYAELMP